MIQRRHWVLIIVWFSFVFTLAFKAFPLDKQARHIPFSKVEMVTKTWVYLGSTHVSIALLLFALIVATDDRLLKRVIGRFIVLEFVSLVDYILTYNKDFWVPEFDSNVIKFVIYSIIIGWIITMDVYDFLQHAKNT